MKTMQDGQDFDGLTMNSRLGCSPPWAVRKRIKPMPYWRNQF